MPTAKKKTTSKKATASKKATTRKATTKKVATKKKVVAKKAAPKKAAVKKSAPKKKVAAKKAAPKKKSPVKKSSTPSAGDNALLSGGMKPYQISKGEDYMNKEQLQHFRDLLHAWKRELMEEVDRTVHHMQDEAANFPDPNDRATQESEFSLELRTRDRERKLIKKIDEAINNLDDEEYGYCESCGIEIGIRRLEARPTATLCIDCKTLDEIREKTRT